MLLLYTTQTSKEPQQYSGVVQPVQQKNDNDGGEFTKKSNETLRVAVAFGERVETYQSERR